MKEEIIGEEIQITTAAHHDLVGMRGIVIDETRHTLCLQTKAGERIVVKDTISFVCNGRKVMGASIAHSPEERIKKQTTVKKAWHM